MGLPVWFVSVVARMHSICTSTPSPGQSAVPCAHAYPSTYPHPPPHFLPFPPKRPSHRNDDVPVPHTAPIAGPSHRRRCPKKRPRCANAALPNQSPSVVASSLGCRPLIARYGAGQGWEGAHPCGYALGRWASGARWSVCGWAPSPIWCVLSCAALSCGALRCAAGRPALQAQAHFGGGLPGRVARLAAWEACERVSGACARV